MSRALTIVLGLSLCLLGCSGPPQSTGDTSEGGGPSADPETVPRTALVAQYETFDAAAYPVRPPQRDVNVDHSVPSRLMTVQADEGVTQTLEGYRIQVYSAQDKQSAEEFRERVRQWWQVVRDEVPEDAFSEDPPIVIEYSQPYYRVRVGAFASRDAADDALSFVRKEYGDAFLAPSTVTITR